MKKIVLVFSFFYYTFLLYSSLYLVGCKSDPFNGPDIIDPPTLPDTLGNVSGYINSSDGAVKGAQISLNDKTTISDSNGFFEFRDCIKKELVIKIMDPEFGEYSNSISVTDSLILNIQLTRIKYDYIPLKVGNQWTYHWTSGWYASGGGGGHSAGTLNWKVESVTGNYPNFSFNIKETRYDSSDNSSTERFFNLITSSSDSLECVGNNYLIRFSKIKRFYDITVGDSVYNFLPYDNYTLKLERKIGVIQCFYGSGGITFGSSTDFEIIDYMLK